MLNSSYFALFLIVALGFMLGRIKIKGLSLDVSAVIFIALLFGHFGVIIPKELGNFGLVLFIFTIGIQAGPGFFDSFRSKGKTLIIITLLIICSAALTATGLKYAFDIDTPSVVGLIAGALTSTPGLAVAIDSTHSPLASIAYGIAYPFGVIGVILFVKLLPRIMHIDLDREARRLEKEGIRTNVTLVFSPAQAIWPAKNGSLFVSPFLGWKEANGEDCKQYIKDIVDIYKNYGFYGKTQIICAAIRTPKQIVDCAVAGADIVTTGLAVYQDAIKHAYTRQGIETFINAWDNTVTE